MLLSHKEAWTAKDVSSFLNFAFDNFGAFYKVESPIFGFSDGPVMCPANVLYSRLRGDYIPPSSGPTKSQNKTSRKCKFVYSKILLPFTAILSCRYGLHEKS